MDRFDMLFNDSDVDKNSFPQNSNLTTEQIDLLYSTAIRKDYLAQYPKLTDEQFMRFFNDDNFSKNYLALNPHLTTEQIDLLYSTEDVDENHLAAYPKLTDEQFNRFFNDENVNKSSLAYNPSINPLPLNKWQAGIFNWSW